MKRFKILDGNGSFDDSAGFAFGAARRTLPWDMEKLTFEFLSISDWARVFFVSHGCAKQTLRFVGGVRHLNVRYNAGDFLRFSERKAEDSLNMPSDVALSPDAYFGAGLLVHHCRGLRSVV